jgi:hypothetical protein
MVYVQNFLPAKTGFKTRFVTDAQKGWCSWACINLHNGDIIKCFNTELLEETHVSLVKYLCGHLVCTGSSYRRQHLVKMRSQSGDKGS